jgi:glycosyltransferase involved in cell wall biosynthesis
MTSRRVLFTCGREPEYVRNLLVLRALWQQFEVVEVTDSGAGSLLLRNLRLLPRLFAALRSPHDLVFVGFYGYLLTLFLSRLTRKPILFDAFVSNWDTLCFDRQVFTPDSIRGRLARALDTRACLTASHCLLDTRAHGQYFARTFGIPEGHISTFYLGYDHELFHPRPLPKEIGRFVVFYYGSFLPLQGLDQIIAAARILQGEQDIEFCILGEGIVYPHVRKLATEWGLERITFQPSVPYASLPDAIAGASLCLGGPFGATAKASRVIAGKTFQFMAMARPTIVGDSPASRELFVHGEDVWMCRLADPQALASAILELKRDAPLRARIAQRGAERCREEFSMEKQGQRLAQIISGVA